MTKQAKAKAPVRDDRHERQWIAAWAARGVTRNFVR